MTDSFDLNSGGGNPSFSFGPQGAQPGASIVGTVTDLAEVQQRNFDTKEPETWDNGDPKMQIRLTLQTDLRDLTISNDTGIRDVYLRGRKRPHDNGAKSTICAALDAVREATGDTKMARGARFAIQWVSGMGFSGDPRNYAASYAAPALDLGGSQSAPIGQPAAPPAFAQPVQQVAPVPQPVAQAPVPQFVQTPQGIVDTTTGQLVQPAAPVAQQVAQAPAPVAVAQPVPGGYTPEQIAAMEAAGVNPAAVAAAAQGSAQPTG